MINDVKLLNHIHQNADMGRDSLRHILDLSHNDDLSKAVRAQIDDYEKTYIASEKMLNDRGAVAEDARATSKFMANMGSRMETMMDSSESKLAEMVIQGSTMGITNLTKQLHDYNGDDEDVKSFAEQLIEKEQANIERMKPFL